MTNHKDQKNYEARQRAKGLVLVKVWVPKKYRAELLEKGKELREREE